MPRLDDAGVQWTDRSRGRHHPARAGRHSRLPPRRLPPALRPRLAADQSAGQAACRSHGRRSGSVDRTPQRSYAALHPRCARKDRLEPDSFPPCSSLPPRRRALRPPRSTRAPVPRSDRHRSADDRWCGVSYTGHDPQAEQPPACRSQTGGTRTPFLGRHAQPPHRERAIHRYASSHQRTDILRSSYEAGGGAVPVRKIRRHIDTEQQHDCQVREHREKRGRVRQARDVRLAEHHGLHRPKIAANATPSDTSRMGVAHGCSRIAVVSIRNSLANTPNGGTPSIASVPAISPNRSSGWW